MAVEPKIVPAPEVAPVVAPVAEVAAAPVAPVAEVAPAAEVVAAPVPEVAKVEVAAEPVAQPSLFTQFDQKKKAEAEKPATEVKAEEPKIEVKKEGEPENKDEPAQVEPEKIEAAKPEPIKFEYKLPENVTLADDRKAEIEGLLTELHASPTPETQQKLIDYHYARINEAIQGYNTAALKAFSDLRSQWSKEVMADPEIGGNAHDSAMQAIAYVRDNFVSLEPRGSKGYETAVKEFDKFLDQTGAGDNPWFLRFAHNISTVLNEPSMQATSDIKPIVQQDGNGRAPIYRHPTSARNGR